MISCFQCVGFWGGLIIGLILQPIDWEIVCWGHGLLLNLFYLYLFYLLHIIITPIVIGFIASYCSELSIALLNYLSLTAYQSNINKPSEEDKLLNE